MKISLFATMLAAALTLITSGAFGKIKETYNTEMQKLITDYNGRYRNLGVEYQKKINEFKNLDHFDPNYDAATAAKEVHILSGNPISIPDYKNIDELKQVLNEYNQKLSELNSEKEQKIGDMKIKHIANLEREIENIERKKKDLEEQGKIEDAYIQHQKIRPLEIEVANLKKELPPPTPPVMPNVQVGTIRISLADTSEEPASPVMGNIQISDVKRIDQSAVDPDAEKRKLIAEQKERRTILENRMRNISIPGGGYINYARISAVCHPLGYVSREYNRLNEPPVQFAFDQTLDLSKIPYISIPRIRSDSNLYDIFNEIITQTKLIYTIRDDNTVVFTLPPPPPHPVMTEAEFISTIKELDGNTIMIKGRVQSIAQNPSKFGSILVILANGSKVPIDIPASINNNRGTFTVSNARGRYTPNLAPAVKGGLKPSLSQCRPTDIIRVLNALKAFPAGAEVTIQAHIDSSKVMWPKKHEHSSCYRGTVLVETSDPVTAWCFDLINNPFNFEVNLAQGDAPRLVLDNTRFSTH